MMLDEKARDRLLALCENTESRVAFDVVLSQYSTISIGGTAAAWFVPSGVEDLREAKLLLRDLGMASFVIGNGSNILIPDDGLKTVVISLRSGSFVRKEFEDTRVLAGAGVKLGSLLADCCGRGLSGLEGLAGIPATVGGALVTNASYRASISDCLEKVMVLDERGETRWIKKGDVKFGYRTSSFDRREIIVEAVFRLDRKRPADLEEELKRNFSEKMKRQPLGEKTLGCVFKNPEDSEYRSGELIDMAGMKGTRRGSAQVSAKHANFIVNNGGAKAREVIALIGDIREKVREEFSIELETEIEILGE